jgi:peptidoglycan hydrolase CwlO-like protein
MTDACERLKAQLEVANKKVAELQEKISIVREENTTLHHKMAQVKGSISIGRSDNNRTSSPDIV